MVFKIIFYIVKVFSRCDVHLYFI